MTEKKEDAKDANAAAETETNNKGNNEFVTLRIDDAIDRSELFGSLDINLDVIGESTGTEIFQRDNVLLLRGGNTDDASAILTELMDILRNGEHIDAQKLNYVIALRKEGGSYRENNISKDIICFTVKGKPLKAKTVGQKNYVNSMKTRDVVFGIGPAGTGKTYLAVAMAVTAFKNKEVQRIILTRPAVEAGEKLGFLPGDLQEKVDPYLRPLYDALYDVLGRDNTLRLREREAIEIVPLAYMRGRTLDSSFIILDEAQNTTREQMKMFLTRMGFGSKVVVTGDKTQIDLPSGTKSGLLEAERVLKHVNGIDFCYLRDVDVVRNEMVRRIIRAYDEYDKRRADDRMKKQSEK